MPICTDPKRFAHLRGQETRRTNKLARTATAAKLEALPARIDALGIEPRALAVVLAEALDAYGMRDHLETSSARHSPEHPVLLRSYGEERPPLYAQAAGLAPECSCTSGWKPCCCTHPSERRPR